MHKAWLAAGVAIAAGMAAPIMEAGAKPKDGFATGQAGKKIGGITMAMCQADPVSYTIEDAAGVAQQGAVGNWEWQVSHTPGLSGYGKWSAAQGKSVSCLKLGKNRYGLPVSRCTATATPCQG